MTPEQLAAAGVKPKTQVQAEGHARILVLAAPVAAGELAGPHAMIAALPMMPPTTVARAAARTRPAPARLMLRFGSRALHPSRTPA